MSERPFLECTECGVKLIPADMRCYYAEDGCFVEHREACRCHLCGWMWSETSEPVKCECGARVIVGCDNIFDEPRAYARTVEDDEEGGE